METSRVDKITPETQSIRSAVPTSGCTPQRFRMTCVQGHCPDTTSSITHGAAFRTIISRRAFGSRRSSSTRGPSLTLLPSFSFRSLERKRLWFSSQSPLVLAESLNGAGPQRAIYGLIVVPYWQLLPSIPWARDGDDDVPASHSPMYTTQQTKPLGLLKPPRRRLSSKLGLAPALMKGS